MYLSIRGSRWNKFTARCGNVGEWTVCMKSKRNHETYNYAPGKLGQHPARICFTKLLYTSLENTYLICAIYQEKKKKKIKI
jgi:hypothetical protein